MVGPSHPSVDTRLCPGTCERAAWVRAPFRRRSRSLRYAWLARPGCAGRGRRYTWGKAGAIAGVADVFGLNLARCKGVREGVPACVIHTAARGRDTHGSMRLDLVADMLRLVVLVAAWQHRVLRRRSRAVDQ